MTSISIASAVDAKGLALIFVVAASLSSHLGKSSFATYYVIYDGPQSPLLEKLKRSHFRHTKIVVVPVVDAPFRAAQMTHESITPATYLRLSLARLLPSVDRLISIDNDVVICRDLSELFNVELGGAPAGGVIDYHIRADYELERLRGETTLQNHMSSTLAIRSIPPNYVNAGVLLLDLEALRQMDFEKRAVAFYETQHHKFYWNDQDVINGVLHDQIALLDSRWNVIVGEHLRRGLSQIDPTIESDIRAQAADPFILHYAGLEKPWHLDVARDRAEQWWHYAVKSPARMDLCEGYLSASRRLPADSLLWRAAARARRLIDIRGLPE